MQLSDAQSFTDEFGPVDGDVHALAAGLLPQAERLAVQTLGDPAVGQQLLMKACALVTRRRAETEITNLPAYLYRVWQRLLLSELEKQNGHRRIEAAHSPTATPTLYSAAELDRRILLQQVIRHMDDWTRRVFEFLTLGFTYDQIAAEIGGNGHAVRVRYDRQLAAIAKRLNSSQAGNGAGT